MASTQTLVGDQPVSGGERARRALSRGDPADGALRSLAQLLARQAVRETLRKTVRLHCHTEQYHES